MQSIASEFRGVDICSQAIDHGEFEDVQLSQKTW